MVFSFRAEPVPQLHIRAWDSVSIIETSSLLSSALCESTIRMKRPSDTLLTSFCFLGRLLCLFQFLQKPAIPRARQVRGLRWASCWAAIVINLSFQFSAQSPSVWWVPVHVYAYSSPYSFKRRHIEKFYLITNALFSQKLPKPHMSL